MQVTNDDKAEKLKYIAGYDPGDDIEPTFTYQGFKIWSKVLIVGAFLAMFSANFHYLNPESLLAHVRTMFLTLFSGKAYMYVDEFVDTAVETGMVAPPHSESEGGEE